MPNETAPAHRHTAFACRFIIEGQGGFTAVQGRRINMQRGDLILTPTWNWHDHGKDGSGPMIWLDTLDLPNFTHFPVHFVEHFSQPRYPAVDVDISNSPIVFPWAKMKAALDAADGDHVALPYLKANGSESMSGNRTMIKTSSICWNGLLTLLTVSRIIGASASRLNASKSSPSLQETASSIWHVVEGSGHSVVDGQKLSWGKGDTFCIPAWYEFSHHADEGETLYLFSSHDKPMLRALGFYRTSADDVESIVSQ